MSRLIGGASSRSNDLAAIREEDDEVFEAIHAVVFRLYAEGWIDGLRIDHVDGLAQPEAYCKKLRARLATLEKKTPGALPRRAGIRRGRKDFGC